MKTLFSSCILFLFFTFQCKAQVERVQTIDRLNSDKIEIETSYGDVEIVTWKEKSIKIETNVNINLGQDNDHFSLTVSNKASGVKITGELDCKSIDNKVIITMEDGTKTIVNRDSDEWKGWDSEDHSVKNINMGVEANVKIKIYMPESLGLNLQSTYGDVKIDGLHESMDVHSTYGDVEVKMRNIGKMDVVSVHSTYGSVDIALPRSVKAALDLSTAYGEIYSDLTLEKDGEIKTNNYCGGSEGRYTLNGGGKSIQVKATYDNIYLRSL